MAATAGNPPGAAATDRRLLEAIGPELALLTVVSLWASTYVVSKNAFAEISPLAFVFVRFALMTLLAFAVLAIARRRGERAVPLERGDLARFVGAGLTGYTLYQLGFVLGLDRTSPFSSSLLIAMVPLFTMVILAARGEATPRFGWPGLAVAVAGVVIFLLDKRGGAGGSVAGDLLSLGAALSFALYGVINRPLARRYPPATYTAYALLLGTIPLLLIGAPAALRADWSALSAGTWATILYMIVFPVYVAYMLWNWGIARRGAATASSFGLLQPILSGASSAIVFDEAFGAPKLLGAALVLAGLAVMRFRAD